MTPGQIAFLGSGETSLAGGRLFEMLARALPRPLRVAILETPAGFELNSGQVAGRVAEFLRTRLQNYTPIIDVVPARKRGTPFSPDEPGILRPLLRADLIFMGPGSPTYMVRQLQGSLAWDMIRARHRLGATLAFASAATVAIGAWALPVYEIYKVGEDVHTKRGLDLFADYGMRLSFVPHWNNTDGGLDLDTSRCFVGMDRFEQWRGSLTAENIIIGLDEHTGIIIDFDRGECEINGVSSVSIVRAGEPHIHPAGARFPLNELGDFKLPQPPQAGIPPEVWERASHAPPDEEGPPAEALALAEQREQARLRKAWAEADRLRAGIAALGWTVQDTPHGPKLVRS